MKRTTGKWQPSAGRTLQRIVDAIERGDPVSRDVVDQFEWAEVEDLVVAYAKKRQIDPARVLRVLGIERRKLQRRPRP